MKKEALYLTDLSKGVELYSYFEELIGVGKEDRLNRCLNDPPQYDPDTVYYLALPFPIVSPLLYKGKSRLSVALDMPPRILFELCIGQRVISSEAVDDETVRAVNREKESASSHGTYYYRYRDCLTVRGGLDEGLSELEALHYLCEHYLDGMTFENDAVIGIRVPQRVVEALSLCEDDFLEDALCEAYARLYLRIARVVKVYHLNAPRIILKNERRMLTRAAVAIADFDEFEE